MNGDGVLYPSTSFRQLSPTAGVAPIPAVAAQIPSMQVQSMNITGVLSSGGGSASPQGSLMTGSMMASMQGSNGHLEIDADMVRDLLAGVQAMRTSQRFLETQISSLSNGQRLVQDSLVELLEVSSPGSFDRKTRRRSSADAEASRSTRRSTWGMYSEARARKDSTGAVAVVAAVAPGAASDGTNSEETEEQTTPTAATRRGRRQRTTSSGWRKREMTGPRLLTPPQPSLPSPVAAAAPSIVPQPSGSDALGSPLPAGDFLSFGASPNVSTSTAGIPKEITSSAHAPHARVKLQRSSTNQSMMAVPQAVVLMDATPSMSLLDRHVRADLERARDLSPMDLAAAENPGELLQGIPTGEESSDGGERKMSRLMSGDMSPLGESWPMSIPMRQTLQGGNDKAGSMASLFNRGSMSTSASIGQDFESEKKRRRTCASDPDGLPLMLVDMVSSIILLHDLFVTPYVVVMDLSLQGPLKALAIVAACFWTLDFLLGFQTGFYVRGELNTKRRLIIGNYMKTWCFGNPALRLDAMVGDDQARTLKVVRLVKVFKTDSFDSAGGQVVRMVQLKPHESNRATGVEDSLRRVDLQSLCVLLVAFHRQTAESDTGSRWLDYSGLEDEPLSEQGLKYQYVTSYHWTLAQMTPGPIDIVASNTTEQVVNSILLILGLLFGSLIVSLCSGQVMQLIMAQREMTLTLQALERFLRQSAIGTSLAIKVKRQVFDRMAEERHITENDVHALNLLSATLRSQVICETRRPHLLTHALFRTWYGFDIGNFNMLCEKAVALQFLSPEDDLFLPEEDAAGCWVNIKGSLLYSQWPENSKVKDFTQKSLAAGAWLCEAGLWSHWIHVGRMEAVTSCQLLFIQADRLMSSVCEKKVVVSMMIKQYGRNFHLRIISSSPPFAAWPDDLHVPFTDMVDLVSKDVGMGLLKKALRLGTLNLPDEKRRALEEELRKEKCALQELPSGELQRIVAVVTLRLHRSPDSDQFLTILGKWVPGTSGVIATCELPGAKRGMGELPQKALQQVLDRHLYPFARFAQLTDITHETFTRESPKFGLCTQYLKTTHVGSLEAGGPPVELPGIRSKDQVESPISPRDIFIIKDGEEVVLYTWVNSSEFAYLNENQQMLAHWLGGLEERLQQWAQENGGSSSGRTTRLYVNGEPLAGDAIAVGQVLGAEPVFLDV
eukprot:CAMPEP_0178379514 /NCGR_PEP_ID=MMETSP0689_2-20121128/4981_1 /TAXON_ID=160604 /ORGANISM="Amphidinium massartii, Strain CS-259" /LENGTH=1176 /DNA_ID=CAMNT_0019999617 /DNA_START=19 /DNA_END=3552 /DNA_ORIENTATION=-